MKAPRPQLGFTLFELMITLALAGVLFAIAVPNMREFSRNNRLSSTANDLLRSFQLGRSEAIKRRSSVVICGSEDVTATDPTCITSGTPDGWIVFQDTDGDWAADGEAAEPVIERHRLENMDGSTVLFTVRGNNDGIVSYNNIGFAKPETATIDPTTQIVLTDSRGINTVGSTTTARALIIGKTGNTRVSRDPVEVAAACEAVGLSALCK